MIKTKKGRTKVMFLIEKPEGDLPCNVFAFFPEDNYTDKDNGTFTCYAHIGQHSACHIDYAKECKEATPEQYADLQKELESIGYKLEVVTRIQPVKKGDSITIIGRRWFDQRAGNTYFSCVALVNGKQAAIIEFSYGYGDQYRHDMAKMLAELGYLPGYDIQTSVLWRYCEERGITLYCTHSDVNRKKDL